MAGLLAKLGPIKGAVHSSSSGLWVMPSHLPDSMEWAVSLFHICGFYDIQTLQSPLISDRNLSKAFLILFCAPGRHPDHSWVNDFSIPCLQKNEIFSVIVAGILLMTGPVETCAFVLLSDPRMS